IYPQLRKLEGLSHKESIDEAERVSFPQRVAFLANYFIGLAKYHHDALKNLICNELEYCRLRERFRVEGEVALYGGDIIVAHFLGLHWAPITLAWLILTGLFDELCDCEPKGWIGKLLRLSFRGRRYSGTSESNQD